jgi:hypothetical protein
MNHSMVSYVVWISTRDTSHNERNVPNPMLYVGNVSDIRLPLSHGRVAIAKRKKGAESGSAFLMPIRQCAISGPAAACRAAHLRFLVPVPDTVDFKAQIGCRASPQVIRNGFFR